MLSGWGALRCLMAPILAVTLAGCTVTARDGGRPTLVQPLKYAGIIATAAGSVLHTHDTTGAPATRPLEHRSAPSIAWLGHSSFLIRLGDKVLLTDPIVSRKIGYHLPLLPKRIAGPPPGIDRLDRLDAVLISHLDHDHFDLATLRGLAAKFPKARLFMPQGTGKHGHRAGFANVQEVGIWKSAGLGSVTLTALPARHFGRRDVVGASRSAAIGWEIAGAARKIYFSGDTAWGNHFAEIRAKRGRYDVALVPIGAYGPEPYFADVHVNPEDALLAASVLGAHIAIGHHWGTFNLGAESPAEAKARFLAAKAKGVRPMVLDVGEAVGVH